MQTHNGHVREGIASPCQYRSLCLRQSYLSTCAGGHGSRTLQQGLAGNVTKELNDPSFRAEHQRHTETHLCVLIQITPRSFAFADRLADTMGVVCRRACTFTGNIYIYIYIYMHTYIIGYISMSSIVLCC